MFPCNYKYVSDATLKHNVTEKMLLHTSNMRKIKVLLAWS